MTNHDGEIWEAIRPVAPGANEAAVEHQVIGPLLAALGYATADVQPKVRVQFTQGVKRGHPFEADFVVYSGPVHDVDTSLMVIEAKAPDKDPAHARVQAESYAQVLKAPLMLLTNGIELQIWQFQPVLRSELVFECALIDIKARRAELEQIASREALLAYAASISFKKLTPEPEFKDYEAAELARTTAAEHAVSRTLRRSESNRCDSEELLSKYPRGATITAPSGYGKTVLCERLARLAIKRRWRDATQGVAAHIALQDFAAGDQPLSEYLYRRMHAHQPGLARPSFEKAMRERGVALMCDAYERVSSSRRDWVDAQLRDFRRDYSRSQLFVFSRGSGVPDLGLDKLELLPFDEVQLRAAATVGRNYLLSSAPRVLLELARVPLLLRLVIDYHRDRGAFPTRLEELFEQWLTRLLQGAPGGAVASARRAQVLELVAGTLQSQSLSLAEAIASVGALPAAEASFDELVAAGVLLVRADRVEPLHEGLADYVRARSFTRLDAQSLRTTLTSIEFDEDSLLPVLLASLAEGAERKSVVWERLKTISARRYIDAVRFGERVLDPPVVQPSAEEVRNFMSDMLAGIEGFASAFMPQLAPLVNASCVGTLEPQTTLSLAGNIAVQATAQFDYLYVPGEQSKEPVEVRWPGHDEQGIHRGLNLSLNGLGLGSGRHLGLTQLRDSVLDVVRRRAFRGGLNLANERTIRRLRYLHRAYDHTLSPNELIRDIIQRYEPVRDRVALGSLGEEDLGFAVASLLDDLEALLAAGRQTLDWWWLPFGSDPHQIGATQASTEGFLKEHYTRTAALYKEIVESSFGLEIASEFPMYMAMPLRWELALVRGNHAFGGYTVHWRWLPAETEWHASVQCEFADRVPVGHSNFEPHATNLRRELQRLKRDVGRYSVGGFCPMPSVSMRELNGQFTGDTSVLREASGWLASDFRTVFEDLSWARSMIGQIPMSLEE